MEASDIYIGVRDNNLEMVGKIKTENMDLSSLIVHCGVGQWTLRLPHELEMADALQTKGYGVVVRTLTEGGWDTLFSGPVIAPSYTRTPEDPPGIVTIKGYDDNILLWDALAWGDPVNAINAQITANDTRNAPAESLMKAYVNYNIGPSALMARRANLAQKVIIEADGATGPTVRKSPRFQNLGELLSEIAIYSGMGFKIVQEGTNLVFKTYTIQDRRPFVRFSIDNGSLSEETTAVQAPSVTRTIVAGQGEGTARNLIPRTTADSTQAEADWGRSIEQWVDQRNTNDTTELQQAGDEPLIAGGFTAIAVKGVPTDAINMKFGNDWGLGDLVKVTIHGSEADSIITQMSLVANSAGVDIGAAIGDVTGFKASSSMQSQLGGVSARVSAIEKGGGSTPSTPDPTPNTNVIRDAAGRFAAVDPLANDDVSTKGYVDARANTYLDDTKVAADTPSTYKAGTTLTQHGTGSGWPYDLATIVTEFINTSRGYQVITEKSGAYRMAWRSVTGSTTWSAWSEFADTAYVDAKVWDGNDITTGTVVAARLPAASETASGIIERATVAEAVAGTDTTRAVTPAGLAGATPSWVGTVDSGWTFGKPNVTLSDASVVSAFLPADDVGVQPGSTVLLNRTVGNVWTIVGVKKTEPTFLRQILLEPVGAWKWYDYTAGDPQFAYMTVAGATSGRFGPGYVTKSSTGWVVLSGLFVPSSAQASGSIITTLPVGFRPAKIMRFLSTNYYRGVLVYPDGTVRVGADAAANTVYSLSNVRFNLDAAVTPITGYANGWSDYGDADQGVASQGVDSLGWAFTQGVVAGGSLTNDSVIASSPTAGALSPGDSAWKHNPTASAATGSNVGAIYIKPYGIGYNTACGGNLAVSLNGNVWDPSAIAVPWVAASFLNSWINYGGTYTPAGFYKRPDGLVAIRGFVKNGTAGAAMFYLPAGYRPKNRFILATVGNSNVWGRIDIYTDGAVVANTVTSNAWFSLEGILFAADH